VAALGVAAIVAAASVGAIASPVTVQCSVRGALPDPGCTPGDLNPQVTQSNVKQTICPPVSYTDPLKQELMRSYRLTGQPNAYELDHFVSLELGGNPTSPKNLWPQAYAPAPGAHEKDRVENYLRKEVCSGAMTLAAAQDKIKGDWTQVLAAINHP
jgi:hypothetical protein